MENNSSWKMPFFTFWISQAISLLGSGLASFALVWWMTSATNSATVLATASMATLLPGILIGPFAGALIDRLNRKWVLIASDALSALGALILVWLFFDQTIQPWHIYLINALRSLAGALQHPSVQSTTSLMVPKDQLVRVAGLNQALQGLTMVATAPLGAWLLAWLPIHSILMIDVVTALFAIGLLAVIAIPRPQLSETAAVTFYTVWQDMRAGWSFLRQRRGLLQVMGIATLLNLVLTPAFTLVPILVTAYFHKTEVELGWMNAAYGFGIIGGGAVLGSWGGFKRRILTSLLGLAGLGVGSLLIGFTAPNAFALAIAGMALIGVMNTFANGPFFAILQSIVPAKMQGRVFTVLMSISMAATPVGLALAGPLADRLGVQLWYRLGAGVCFFMVAWIVFSPQILHLEETEAPLKAASEKSLS